MAFIIIVSILLLIFSPFDSIIKAQVEKSLGPNFTFKHLKVHWNSLLVKNCQIKVNKDSNIMEIEQIKLNMYFLSLLKKKVEIKSIEIDRPYIYLKKDKSGKWIVPSFPTENKEPSSFMLKIRELKVKDGVVVIEDESNNFKAQIINLKSNITSEGSLFKEGKTYIEVMGDVLQKGKIFLKGTLDSATAIHEGMIKIDDLNAKLLEPYIKGDTQIKKGYLGFYSNYSVKRGYVTAPSTLILKDFVVEKRGLFMGVSTKLIMELMEKNGQIEINFNIWGRWNNLQNDLESSFKKKVLNEIGSTLTSPLKQINKAVKSLI